MSSVSFAPLVPFQPDTSVSAAAAYTVPIALGDRSYPIHIGAGAFADARAWANLPKAQTALIVTNTTVGPLYAAALQDAIAGVYERVHVIALPDGEAYKDWLHLQRIFDVLLENQADRKTVLFALGGGVIGDMTGFAAACYMRGVPFVQVPTTLLSQVDSSVGGKTAVNHPAGKNMIGAFYQPERVVCDLNALTTLPPREVSAGLAEVIKYGPIADLSFLDWLERHMDELRNGHTGLLAQAVKRSCEIKAWVVGQDEREAGLRAILNFGHTLGHAIETYLLDKGKRKILHGEAIAIGMIVEAFISHQRDLISLQELEEIESYLFENYGRVKLHSEEISKIIALTAQDKKNKGKEIRFSLLTGIGDCGYDIPVSASEMKKAIQYYLN